MSTLARQRRRAILDTVRRNGGARVTELVEVLGVSDMTIRRDISQLAERGLLVRVHGGATVADAPPSSHEPSFRTKLGEQPGEKLAIARMATGLVPADSSVALSAGTTTLALAQELREVAGLTVVTNSIPVAEALHDPERRDRTVILTGGTRTPSDALVGPVAVTALRDLHVDQVFLGVHGFSERTGCTSPNMVEADTNQALVAAAATTVVVADHTKLRLVGLSTFIALDDIDVLVSDSGLTDDDQSMLRTHVGRLLVAPVDQDEPSRPSGSENPEESPA